MTKPARAGLDYFPLDTNFFFDRRVQRVYHAHTMSGVGIYLFILSRIYEKDGYYIAYDKDFCFDIGSLLRGTDEKIIKKVVDTCIKVELFDPGMFKKNRILTSVDIQQRFLTARKKGRNTLISNYLLVKLNPPAPPETDPNGANNDLNGTNSGLNDANSDISADESPQRKGKEKKGKEKTVQKKKENTTTKKINKKSFKTISNTEDNDEKERREALRQACTTGK